MCDLITYLSGRLASFETLFGSGSPSVGGPVPQSVFHQCVTVTLCLSVYLFSFTLSLLLSFPYSLFLFPRPSVPLFLSSSDSRSPLFSDFGFSYYFMFRFLPV